MVQFSLNFLQLMRGGRRPDRAGAPGHYAGSAHEAFAFRRAEMERIPVLMDRSKILKMVLILMVIIAIVGGLSRMMQKNSMSLTEYVQQNANSASQEPEEK